MKRRIILSSRFSTRSPVPRWIFLAGNVYIHPRKFNSSPLNNGAWKTTFLLRMQLFRGELLNFGRVCVSLSIRISFLVFLSHLLLPRWWNRQRSSNPHGQRLRPTWQTLQLIREMRQQTCIYLIRIVHSHTIDINIQRIWLMCLLIYNV